MVRRSRKQPKKTKNPRHHHRYSVPAASTKVVLWVLAFLLTARKLWSNSSFHQSLAAALCKAGKSFPEEPFNTHTNQTTTRTDDPAELAFSKLELFLSAFPGTPNPKDNDDINGFVELKETFIRSLQFFWPRDRLHITAVLDDTTYSTEQEKDQLQTTFHSLFDKDLVDRVRIQFNHRTNKTLYGSGWYIQQLIMLWADNFTDAEYIGFVDDDTLVSSVVRPTDIFDQHGRPRVIGQPPHAGNRDWIQATRIAFQRPANIYTMTYFPVVVQRHHLAEMRTAILNAHPEHASFDDFFIALIHRNHDPETDTNRLTPLSQFCLIMDHVYETHPDEYAWHIDPYLGKGAIPEPYLEPYPRISIHTSYMFFNVMLLRRSKTLAGRRQTVSDILKEGYCYSLPKNHNNDSLVTSTTATAMRRCAPYRVDNGIYDRGEWRFEQRGPAWNATQMAAAHAARMTGNVEHAWNETELTRLFGF